MPASAFVEPDASLQRLLDQRGDALAAPHLVLVGVEGAADDDGIERAAVGGGEDLRVDDVGVAGRAGAGDDGEEARMVGREHGQLGRALECHRPDLEGELQASAVGAAHELGVAHLPLLVDAQPIGGIVEVENALALRLRPVREPSGQRGARLGEPLRVRGGAEAAGQDRLGLVIERAQQLALPAVPDARPDRADVADGEDEEQLQPLRRLHDLRKIHDRAAVGEVARLGDPRHGQMLLDQPGDELGLVGREPEARAELSRHLGAGDRMILRPALGDVVQEERDGQHRQVLQRRQDLPDSGCSSPSRPVRMPDSDADRADQVLVHRIMVVHVELHHRDDLAEVGDEAAEHAGLVHVAEHRLGIVRIAEDLQEQPVRLRIVLQLAVDRFERLA